MFNGESEYQSIIDKINKVQHNYGLSHKLSIPRMVIIGDQSSGKSSVLEAITKLSFPRDKNMCTRFAIQVNLRRNSSSKEDVLSARIEGEDEFNKLNTNIPTSVFHKVIEDAKTLLCRNNDVSEKVLELNLSGPSQSPLTVVDLPGFINTTTDKQEKNLPETIYAINRRYIKEPRTIILAVVQANADLNTSRALSEAGAPEHDPEGERTIPIVTKPDRIENGLHQDWIDVILNKCKTMKLGYLVMCNSGYEQKNMSWDEARQEEEKFFRTDPWNSIPENIKGRVAVRKLLGNLLYEHVSRELPALKREVDAVLDSFKRDLKSMDTPIANTDEAREKLNTATLCLLPQVKGFLDADYDHGYIATFKRKPIPEASEDPYFVRSSLLKLYHDYRSAMSSECNRLSRADIMQQVARYKGNDLPGFVSFTTFKNIVNGHYLDGWKTITKEHVQKMHSYLSKSLSGFISHSADAAARDVFTHVFDRFSRNQALKIEDTIKDIFEDESTPFTLSRHYLETILKERSKNNHTLSLPNDLSDIDMNNNSIDSPPLPFNSTQSSQSRTPDSPVSPQVRFLPHTSKSNDSTQSNNNWNDDHTASEMIPCLFAYLKTARERIVDKVLMETIERHMIKRINEYFFMLNKVSNGDLACMLESPALKRRRQDLETKIVDFESILGDL